MNGRILWANLHLLFWLSLVPFVTAWMGESHFAPLAVAAYGVPLLLSGVAYYVLERALIAHDPHDSMLGEAVGVGPQGHRVRRALCDRDRHRVPPAPDVLRALRRRGDLVAGAGSPHRARDGVALVAIVSDHLPTEPALAPLVQQPEARETASRAPSCFSGR